MRRIFFGHPTSNLSLLFGGHTLPVGTVNLVRDTELLVTCREEDRTVPEPYGGPDSYARTSD
jgi:hypothetical protein